MLLDKLKSKGRRGWHSFSSHFRSEHKPVATADKNLSPLPLELLIETASYFSRWEAAEVLTVNSVFHDAFSRVVWSYVFIVDSNAHLLLKSAWKKYGHLVRTSYVDLEEVHKLPAVSMPNLVELDLEIKGPSLRLFESIKLPHLRRLSLKLGYEKWIRADFKKGVELAQRLKRNGQPVEVEWDACATSEDDMLMLDEMLGLADDTAFDSLSLTVMSIFESVGTLSHLPRLAFLLKSMEFSCSRAFHSIFVSDLSVIFPRLEFLQMDGLSLEDYSCGRNTITPQRLPALKKLWLFTAKDEDQHWVSNVLNSGKWSNLTDLVLSCCSDSLDFEAVVAHTPNLENLRLSDCSFRLNIASIGSLLPRLEHISLSKSSAYLDVTTTSSILPNLEHLDISHCSIDVATIVSLMPRLKHLILGDSIQFSYDAAQVPQLQHTSLKTLEFQHYWARGDGPIIQLPLLQFIVNGAPNLESVELHGCGVSMDDLKTLSGQLNPSVRTLRIEFGEKNLDSDSVAAMVGLFPNLKKCTVIDDEYKARKILPDQHPNLKFVFHPTH